MSVSTYCRDTITYLCKNLWNKHWLPVRFESRDNRNFRFFYNNRSTNVNIYQITDIDDCVSAIAHNLIPSVNN